jgi:hypothetical protein
MNQRFWSAAATLVVAALASSSAVAGTYKTITVDGNYADWAGVPVVDADPADNFSGPDIGDTQIANDGQFLYIRNTFHNSLSLGTFITIDVDENPATGFDIFGLGLVGSEAGWQNDFGFTQATGVFNDGVGLAGEFFGGGHALLDSFADGGSRELAVSLANARNGGGAATFPDNTIRLLVWTDKGTGADGLPVGFPNDDGRNFDVSGVIDYTLGVVPEPTGGILSLGFLGVALVRRRVGQR